ncbi:hypothetical protein, partial [Sinorhizobium meliloti]|uniref:hypothetical protein n=1 Tax=Rhizobium meliloti TaxID=382 RepID=UPI000FD4B064
RDGGDPGERSELGVLYLRDGRCFPLGLANVTPSAGQPGQNGPREIILRVIAEEGPMFRPVIRSESRGVSVETIKQYDAAKANI